MRAALERKRPLHKAYAVELNGVGGLARLRRGDNAVYRHEGAEDENKHKRPHRTDRHMRMRDRLSLYNSQPPHNGVMY